MNNNLCKADTKPAKEAKLEQAEQKSLLLPDDEKLATKIRIYPSNERVNNGEGRSVRSIVSETHSMPVLVHETAWGNETLLRT